MGLTSLTDYNTPTLYGNYLNTYPTGIIFNYDFNGKTLYGVQRDYG
jgi:hypothetical protein